jgi:hypothetical protein
MASADPAEAPAEPGGHFPLAHLVGRRLDQRVGGGSERHAGRKDEAEQDPADKQPAPRDDLIAGSSAKARRHADGQVRLADESRQVLLIGRPFAAKSAACPPHLLTA